MEYDCWDSGAQFWLSSTTKAARNRQELAFGRKQPLVTLVTGPDQCVCANFSLIYGAAALGIEYGILPWKKKATRAAIEKCLAGAFATLRNSSPLAPHAATFASIGIVARKLSDDLDRLTLTSVKKGAPCSGEEAVRRQKADGFRIERKIFIKRQSWKPTDAAKGLLIEHQILQTQRRDVATVDRKIMGIPGKHRYYVIDGERLAAVVAPDSDQSD